MRTVACGSLPFLRIGTKPAESWCATAPPRMKPRASMPATLSALPPAIGVDERVDGAAEGARVAQERGDVAEHDPGLRVVGDRPDRRPKVGDVRLVHPFYPCHPGIPGLAERENPEPMSGSNRFPVY